MTNLPFEELSKRRLSELISDYQAAKGQYRRGLSFREIQQYAIRSIAAVEHIAGRSSVYYSHVSGIVSSTTPMRVGSSPVSTKQNMETKLEMLIGVVQSLAVDLEGDYISRQATLIRGEVFSDFLEMAAHLVGSNYKDAAAVIAGSALEAHLKQLCQNREISLERERNGQVRPVNADTLNAELAKSGAYANLDQKNVTAWLGLRNDAAHGNYDAYSKQQVVLMIDSIREFIIRNPE